MALEELEDATYLSRFTSYNPARWICDAERFFSFYAIYEEERFPYVVEWFDDEPFSWFNSWYRGPERLTWKSFTTALLHRFQPPPPSCPARPPLPSCPARPPPLSPVLPLSSPLQSTASLLPPPSLSSCFVSPSIGSTNITMSSFPSPTLRFVSPFNANGSSWLVPFISVCWPHELISKAEDLKSFTHAVKKQYINDNISQSFNTCMGTRTMHRTTRHPFPEQRREWRPPWQLPLWRPIETKPNAFGRREWRPPWTAHSVLEDKDFF
ncbi:hypothetical protein HanRHA438_Chr03g0108411 [Helianthus annuus]|nr:hypothetical protein HanIR_Chr03g0106241 [Helianthus annuus]KAJ0934525.1 hypothetical protein HanRHA438_Chr03g0108411 [Helianthus annuus]